MLRLRYDAAVNVSQCRGKYGGLALLGGDDQLLVIELRAAAVRDVVEVGREDERAIAMAVRAVDMVGVEALARLVPLDPGRILRPESRFLPLMLRSIDTPGDSVQPDFPAPRVTQVSSVHAKTLQRAAEIVGGEQQLALRLKVTPSHLALWIQGIEQPPGDIFLQAVDLVVDNDVLSKLPAHTRLPAEGADE